MAKRDIKPEPVRSALIEVELEIDAPRARVWKALVDETSKWWHKDFFATKDPRSLRIDARPGGAVIEESKSGGGIMWFSVTEVAPMAALGLAGHISPPWGGPATSIVRLTLEDTGEGATRLKIADHLVGCVSREMEAGVKLGWQTLYGSLKTFVEATRKR